MKRFKYFFIVFGTISLLFITEFLYVAISKNKPLILLSKYDYYETIVSNGQKYNSLFYDYYTCKNETIHLKTKWNKFECPNERKFADGFYITESSVKISKKDFEILNNYVINENFILNADWIDLMEENYLYGYLQRIKDDDFREMCTTDEFTSDNIRIVTLSENHKSGSRGDFCTDKTKYCFLGWKEDGFPLLVPYENGECQIEPKLCEEASSSENSIKLDKKVYKVLYKICN